MTLKTQQTLAMTSLLQNDSLEIVCMLMLYLFWGEMQQIKQYLVKSGFMLYKTKGSYITK